MQMRCSRIRRGNRTGDGTASKLEGVSALADVEQTGPLNSAKPPWYFKLTNFPTATLQCGTKGASGGHPEVA